MLLAVVTIAAYWPVLGAEFVNYDDPKYVSENQHVVGGLTLDGAKWAFAINSYASNWHPLTWLSHMLDCELFGLNAGLHHLTNLIIHTTSAILLLLVLASMTGNLWPSAFVAAAFALHPLHVESVAWIAERKDVLSGLFWVLTMACYLRYTRTGGRGSYSLALVVFGLGLMAKPMLVTLPFGLLLLDYWPLNRLDSDSAVSRLPMVRPLVVEKIPFFVLSATSCVITYIAQKAGGAMADIESLSFIARLSNAVVSYIAYIAKMVWPVGLAVFYPLKHIPQWQSLSAFFVLAFITVAAVFWCRRRRYFAVGWLWYIGTLVPVIGLMQVGSQCLADRYTYIPLIGLFMIAAWVVTDFCRNHPALRIIWGVVAVLLLTGMFAGTRNQLGYWKNSLSLFRRAIQVTKNNNFIHNNLGAELVKAGRLDEAIGHFRTALQIDPDIARAHNNLGLALVEKGQLDEAISCFRRAVLIKPEYANAHNNLGAELGKKGQLDEAIGYFRRAVQINPNFAMAHYNLGLALAEKGQLDEAISHSRQSLKLQPEHPSVLNDLAWILATATDPALRDPAEAVRLSEKACDLTGHKNTVFLNTLAVAYFSANRFDEAASTAEKTLKLAEAAGNENLAQEIRGRLELFKKGKSHIDKPLIKDNVPE